MGKIKGWMKNRETPTYVSYKTYKTKDYNVGQPAHLRTKDHIFSKNVITVQKQWSMKDIVANNQTNANAVWVVRFPMSMRSNKHFKTKVQALKFAMSYMRSHPRG